MSIKTFEILVQEAAEHFKSERFYYLESFHIIFVCGAATTNDKSVRNKFLNYSKEKSNNLRFLLAEQAIQTLNGTQKFTFSNLAVFEDLLAKIAHCVLIFVESPGSIAEVGYFSRSLPLRKKIKIVSFHEFQDDSFLNLGPIALIDSETNFGTKFIFNQDISENEFDQIIKKLDSLKGFSKYSRKIEWKKRQFLDSTIHLGLILKFLDMFRVLTIAEVKKIFTACFGYFEWDLIDNYISVLAHLELLEILEHRGHLTLRLTGHKFIDVSCREFEEKGFKLRAAAALSERNLEDVIS